MKRLCAAQHRGHCLNRGSNDVHFGLLRGQRRSGGLSVEAKHKRTRIASAEPVSHYVRPHSSGRPEFSILSKNLLVELKKEAKPRPESSDVQTGANAA